jgi:hypothetical protein
MPDRLVLLELPSIGGTGLRVNVDQVLATNTR